MRSWILSAVTYLAVHSLATALAAEEAPPVRREPVAVVHVGEYLWVANRQSGTISVVDLEQARVVNEVQVGQGLADLAAVPGQPWLMVVDELGHELILLERNGHALRVLQRVAVPHSPVTICVDAEGTFCSVASLWARQVTLFAIQKSASQPLELLAERDLPFAPRRQVLAEAGRKLLVADAFGGRLAIFDRGSLEQERLLELGMHNLGGLVADDDEQQLRIAHQHLDSHAATEHENIYWGDVVSSQISAIAYADLFGEHPQRPWGGKGDVPSTLVYPLSTPGDGSGDPGMLVETEQGVAAVALTSLAMVALRSAPGEAFLRYPVRSLPRGLAFSEQGEWLFVANSLDDTLSKVPVADPRAAIAIPLGPAVPLNLVERGRQLFFDARLSLDGWYSCHSCHVEGHTNGRLNDNFGDGSFGEPKRIPSLLGTAATDPWGWDGSKNSLVEQIHQSIQNTMDGSVQQLGSEDLQAIAAYLEQLEPPPGLDVARGRIDRDQVDRGAAVFAAQGCSTCHAPPHYTTPDVYDVGLVDAAGNRQFNPPSLRGVSQRGPYLHDGQAASLDELLWRVGHGGGDQLPPAERADLVAFLRSL